MWIGGGAASPASGATLQKETTRRPLGRPEGGAVVEVKGVKGDRGVLLDPDATSAATGRMPGGLLPLKNRGLWGFVPVVRSAPLL